MREQRLLQRHRRRSSNAAPLVVGGPYPEAKPRGKPGQRPHLASDRGQQPRSIRKHLRDRRLPGRAGRRASRATRSSRFWNRARSRLSRAGVGSVPKPWASAAEGVFGGRPNGAGSPPSSHRQPTMLLESRPAADDAGAAPGVGGAGALQDPGRNPGTPAADGRRRGGDRRAEEPEAPRLGVQAPRDARRRRSSVRPRGRRSRRCHRCRASGRSRSASRAAACRRTRRLRRSGRVRSPASSRRRRSRWRRRTGPRRWAQSRRKAPSAARAAAESPRGPPRRWCGRRGRMGQSPGPGEVPPRVGTRQCRCRSIGRRRGRRRGWRAWSRRHRRRTASAKSAIAPVKW